MRQRGGWWRDDLGAIFRDYELSAACACLLGDGAMHRQVLKLLPNPKGGKFVVRRDFC
jgi:hypothetical protein